MFGQYAASEQDLTRAPHLRTSLLIQAPVRVDRLPPAPPDRPTTRQGQRAARLPR